MIVAAYVLAAAVLSWLGMISGAPFSILGG